MGNIKVRGRMQRVAVINQNRVLARAVRYSTVKQNELVSYAARSVRSRSMRTMQNRSTLILLSVSPSVTPRQWKSRMPSLRSESLQRSKE